MTLSPDAEVAVVGAGTMGEGIARVAAAAGHPVALYDAREGAATRAIDKIRTDLDRQVERGKTTRADAESLLARIYPALHLDMLGRAKFVVEAIVEDRAAKIALFRELEHVVGPETILATNTSSISVTAIGGALRHPERCVGMHFFNPAHLMPLVEVVAPPTAAEDAVATVMATAIAWGKRPIRVASTPGFVVNRVARPFYAEALRTRTEFFAEIADVDAAMTESGGFRMGPFRLMDLIGNDVNYAVTRSVFEAFAYDRRFAPSLLQEELVDAGRLGRKTGRGYYQYDSGDHDPQPRELAPGPLPGAVVAYGDLGAAHALVTLAREEGLALAERPGDAPRIEVDGVALVPTDGALAVEHDRARPTVLFDLALDYARCRRIVVTASGSDAAAKLAVAAGFFQSLGKKVTPFPDVPGMIVMRTVAAIANEASTMLGGELRDETIDLAMTLGVGYPIGPLAWGGRIGWPRVLHVLDELSRLLGPERYRPAPVLRMRALGVSTV
ncbi:MAG TPA: 3-hydroxyacyl-CoA dehydrogenase [Candidatus Elarobacter sp.]